MTGRGLEIPRGGKSARAIRTVKSARSARVVRSEECREVCVV